MATTSGSNRETRAEEDSPEEGELTPTQGGSYHEHDAESAAYNGYDEYDETYDQDMNEVFGEDGSDDGTWN